MSDAGEFDDHELEVLCTFGNNDQQILVYANSMWSWFVHEIPIKVFSEKLEESLNTSGAAPWQCPRCKKDWIEYNVGLPDDATSKREEILKQYSLEVCLSCVSAKEFEK